VLLADGSRSVARLLKNSSHRLMPRRDEHKGIVVINRKTTKFESNSQLSLCAMQLISQKQRKQPLQRRNEKIRGLFSEHTNKCPQWCIGAVIEEVAGRVFLSPRTVEVIISFEGVYAES
jgi:hypothetical protein